MQRLFTLFFLLMASYSFGQNVTLVQIERAGILTNRFVDGKEVRLLKNDVAFRQGDVFMTCDSAYQYEKDNKVTAFGNVHITQHDTLNLYGQLLDYDGNTKYAVITRNVRMQDRRMTLLTERLEYNMKNKNAYYSTGAVITQDDTKLTSKKGNYVAATRDFYFKENVILTNPKYVIKCDTLQYNTATNTSYFHGPTNITTKNDSIYCETGSYNTTSGEAHFGKNASLTSKGQILYGDSLEYYRDLQMGRARGNVRMIDTTEKMTAFGAYAEHYEKTNETFITGNPLVSKKFETDTVYITGDTLRSRYDSIGKYKIIRAHKHVKVYGRQFQAKCDSLIYSFKDSTIDLIQDPVFWFGEYQATATHIRIYTKNNKINKADLNKKAFMLTPEDAQRFSQVKGRDMKAFFVDNQLSQINVKGNGESIYYARDEKKAYVGVNKISSTDIKISVKDRKIDRINFIKEPDAILTPIKDASPMDFLLQGFKNRTSERPTVQIAEWQPIQLPSDFTPKKLESKSKSGKKTKKKK